MEVRKQKTWFKTLTWCFTCTFALLPVLAQTNLAGFWALHVPNGDGTYRETFFELQQDGETITGTLRAIGQRGLPITGTYKDGKLAFQTTPPPPPTSGTWRPSR